jgi:hypothetical protein
LQADLPPASVEDNLRFYETLRAKLGTRSGAPPAARLSALPADNLRNHTEIEK